jgi:hypothetical protein
LSSKEVARQPSTELLDRAGASVAAVFPEKTPRELVFLPPEKLISSRRPHDATMGSRQQGGFPSNDRSLDEIAAFP